MSFLKNRIYSSYDEINRDLEMLQTQKKLSYYKMKQGVEDLKENITIPNLVEGAINASADKMQSFGSSVLQRVIPIVAKKIMGFFKK